MRKPMPLAALVGLMGLLQGAPAQASDTSGSMRVGDLQYGNAFDPGGWAPMTGADPRGMSWLHAGMLRTPTGALYPYPPLLPPAKPVVAGSEWTYRGLLQFGYLYQGGDRNAEFFRQYADWHNGFALGLLSLAFSNASTGQYAEFRGSRMGADDQYYRLRGGKYGSYRIEAFYRDIPHTVSTNAYPLWNGVGSTDLTLPAPLQAGASTPAQVAAVEQGRARRDIGLTRTRSGLSYEGALYRGWVGFAAVTNEKREGTRLWGGPMFFNYPFQDNGGVLETVRPIDFTTTDVNVGLRNVGKLWHFNAVYTGSFFRDHKNRLDFQSPYRAMPVIPGVPPAGVIDQGEFSLEPDNDYHNLRLELSRELKWNGELSLAGAWGTMRQNDALLPPVTCTGKGGFMLGPADYTFNCADWNTTAALSRRNANARIDTGLLDARLNFHPTPKFSWRGELRWYREDNKTRYLAFNPLTGQYGYISENGSQGTTVPGELGIFDPRNPLYQSALVAVRNVPFSYTDAVLTLAGDWYASRRDTLSLEYSFDRNRPKYRERRRVDEQRIKLGWVHRASDGPTIRLSYEYADRGGDRYNYAPYDAFMSSSLPGFVTGSIGLPAWTTAAMRKYDLSDRKETKARAIITYPWGDSVTLSATFYGNRDQYGADVGRQSTSTTGFTGTLDWQPAPATNANIYIGAEGTRLKLANVNDKEVQLGLPGQDDASLGGPLYPLANYWRDVDRECDYNVGFSFSHDFGRARLHLGYNWTWSVSRLDYNRASDGALTQANYPANAADIAAAGMYGAFPNNHYRVGTLDASLDFRLSPRVGMRLLGRYESGSFLDWHYAGFDNSLVYDHRIYTDRGPQLHYHASLVGVMLDVKL